MDQVLVLNNNYQPLNVTNAQRAVAMLYLGKVEVLASDSKVLRSERAALRLPTVVRLRRYIRRPLPQLRASRKSIFARDAHTCQYCGRRHVALTLDHVTPRNRGGRTDWDNLVCCCTRCNNIKGDRTPEEAELTLLRPPRRPKYIPYIAYTKFLEAMENPHWRDYLAPYGDNNRMG
jgi:5-methylcytosine-specific restriction endonuclease McrA